MPRIHAFNLDWLVNLFERMGLESSPSTVHRFSHGHRLAALTFVTSLKIVCILFSSIVDRPVLLSPSRTQSNEKKWYQVPMLMLFDVPRQNGKLSLLFSSDKAQGQT